MSSPPGQGPSPHVLDLADGPPRPISAQGHVLRAASAPMGHVLPGTGFMAGPQDYPGTSHGLSTPYMINPQVAAPTRPNYAVSMPHRTTGIQRTSESSSGVSDSLSTDSPYTFQGLNASTMCPPGDEHTNALLQSLMFQPPTQPVAQAAARHVNGPGNNGGAQTARMLAVATAAMATADGSVRADAHGPQHANCDGDGSRSPMVQFVVVGGGPHQPFPGQDVNPSFGSMFGGLPVPFAENRQNLKNRAIPKSPQERRVMSMPLAVPGSLMVQAAEMGMGITTRDQVLSRSAEAQRGQETLMGMKRGPSMAAQEAQAHQRQSLPAEVGDVSMRDARVGDASAPEAAMLSGGSAVKDWDEGSRQQPAGGMPVGKEPATGSRWRRRVVHTGRPAADMDACNSSIGEEGLEVQKGSPGRQDGDVPFANKVEADRALMKLLASDREDPGPVHVRSESPEHEGDEHEGDKDIEPGDHKPRHKDDDDVDDYETTDGDGEARQRFSRKRKASQRRRVGVGTASAKKELSRERNRTAQRRFRERQKDLIRELQEKVDSQEALIQVLTTRLAVYEPAEQ